MSLCVPSCRNVVCESHRHRSAPPVRSCGFKNAQPPPRPPSLSRAAPSPVSAHADPPRLSSRRHCRLPSPCRDADARPPSPDSEAPSRHTATRPIWVCVLVAVLPPSCRLMSVFAPSIQQQNAQHDGAARRSRAFVCRRHAGGTPAVLWGLIGPQGSAQWVSACSGGGTGRVGCVRRVGGPPKRPPGYK